MPRLTSGWTPILLAALALTGCSAPPEGPPAEVSGTFAEGPGPSAETVPAPSPTLRRTAGRLAESADAALVALAREEMGSDARREHCGPYDLVTDVLDIPLLAACARLAQQLDRVFAERYGVEPVGEPKATILLFADLEAYREFTRRHGRVAAGYAGYTLASRGLAVFYLSELPRGTFLATLAHELTHLVIRRAFGDGLPPWLAEGLADGVGDTATEEGFAPLDDLRGIRVQLERLQGAYDLDRAGGVERLVSLERSRFDRGVISYDYEQSALLVRWLLADPVLTPRFRAFLADLAGGLSWSSERFRHALGVPWPELDRRLEAWVRAESPAGSEP